MAEKMKTNNEDDADAGTSSGTGTGGAATTTNTTNTTTTTTTTTTTADNNGGLVSGTGSGGGSVTPHPPTSPNPTGNLAARARMSAVLQLWSGRGSMANRAKSLDFTDEHLSHHQLRQKRNSLVTASNSAIQAAATTAATAAAAATASCGSYEEPSSSRSLDRASSYSNEAMDNGCHKVQLAPSASVDNSLLEPVSPVAGFRLPHIGSARYVQLAASIPEDTDETEDGACTGGKFKITDKNKMSDSKEVESLNSLPSSWPDTKTSPNSIDQIVPLTPDKIGSFSEDVMAATSRSNDLESGPNRAGRGKGRNSIATRSAGMSVDSLPVPSKPRPLRRQLSQDMDRQGDRRLTAAVSSSLTAEDSENPAQGPIIVDIH
ncbi:hypothetical protein ACOMHN_035626 [Nucella lapillus]